MSKKDNVKKIKSYIDEVLGTKSSLRKKLPSKISHEKQNTTLDIQNKDSEVQIFFF